MIDKNSAEEVRREIDKIKSGNKDEEIVVLGGDIGFNRKILEMRNVNILVLSHKLGKDKLKERDSGLNHVLCAIAKEKNITLGIDFSDFLIEDKKEKAKRLSMLIQNIKLVKKFKNKTRVLRGDDNLSVSALFRVLGADTKLAGEITR